MGSELYELALFAGAGGGVLGTTHLIGWKTVCYVEWKKYPVEVLKARINDGYLDDAPIWSDVRSFTKRNNQCRRFIRGLRKIRYSLVVTAGFPCQPFSVAGQGLGENDPRNGWPHTIRIIREIRPRFVFLENVPGLVSSGYIFTVINDLVDSAYAVHPPLYLSAGDVGANHKRERVWIVADADGDRQWQWANESERQPQCRQAAYVGVDGSKGIVADAQYLRRFERPSWWATEPDVGRVANGLAARVDRLTAIGNGQVPDVAALAWRILTGDYDDR